MNRHHTLLIDRLESGSADIADAVSQLTEAQLMRVPKAGEWSLHADMFHLRDTEKLVFVYRVGLILSSKTPPVVENFPGDEYMRDHYDPKEPIKNIVADFRRARRKLVTLLRGTTDKDWSRYAIHPEYGNIPVEYIALHSYSHTLDHLRQLVEAHEIAVVSAANKK